MCLVPLPSLQTFKALGTTLEDQVPVARVEPAAYRIFFEVCAAGHGRERPCNHPGPGWVLVIVWGTVSNVPLPLHTGTVRVPHCPGRASWH